jgi:hypothetical protein
VGCLRERLRPRSEHGQALIVVAFALTVIFGMAAVAVDASNLMVKRRSAQNAADAAALAVAQAIGDTCDATCLANGGTYSALNGGPSNLHACNDPSPSHPTDTDCYAYPYVDRSGKSHDGQVEVRLKQSVGGFFTNAVGLGKVFSVTARAVAGVVPGQPPPYTFVSLNNERSCPNHTLVVRLGGLLTVTNNVYVNSCSDHDGFDLFGPGGNLSAPDIRTHGGWETHDRDTVTVGGTLCTLGPHVSPPQTADGCPLTGQPVLADPFAGKIPIPKLGSPACNLTGTVAYSQAQTLGANINAITTSLTSSGTAIQNGDYIQIDNEIMLVTAGGGTKNLTVVREQLGTHATAHVKPAPIVRVVGSTATAASPSPCVVTSGNVTLSPGTYYGGICIGADGGSDCIGANCAAQSAYSSDSYNSKQTLNNNGGINKMQTDIVSSGTAIQDGDVIAIDNEWMLVTAGGGTKNLTVVRGYLGTAADTHAKGTEILKVTAHSAAQVTLTAGTYVMAGGGFHVCGLSVLSAPDVMIYNTQDPTNTSRYGAIDQVELNTTGSVTLGAQDSGLYKGLTIFQDGNLEVARDRYGSNDTCDTKSKSADTTPPNPGDVTEWDIALVSMASSGAGGALGSVSGTIYAPSNRAMFADSVSGTADLAVLSGCIFIDGSTSTFAFTPDKHFGVGVGLTE